MKTRSGNKIDGEEKKWPRAVKNVFTVWMTIVLKDFMQLRRVRCANMLYALFRVEPLHSLHLEYLQLVGECPVSCLSSELLSIRGASRDRGVSRNTSGGLARGQPTGNHFRGRQGGARTACRLLNVRSVEQRGRYLHEKYAPWYA